MTRIQKHRAQVIAVYCVDLVLVALLGLIHMGKNHPMTNIFFVVCVALLLFSIWWNMRRQKIILTPEEMQFPLEPYSEYNNSFEWKRLIAFIFLVFFVFAMLTLPLWLEMKTLRDTTVFYLWILMAFTITILLVPFFRHFRNQYIIDGDTLIIREYNFFRPEPELRIPLNTISEVYIKNTLTLFPSLYLVMNGPDFRIDRQVYATTHTISLAVALSKAK